MTVRAVLAALVVSVSFCASAAPKVTRAPFFSDPRMFERIGIEVETRAEGFAAAAGISHDRVSEILMAKGYQVVDLSVISPEMRSGLAIMKVTLNQVEVREERNEKRAGGGWLGEQNRKYGPDFFYYFKGNISVSVVAADSGARLWMASDSLQTDISDAQSWDAGLLKMVQGVSIHFPGIDDKGVSVDDKVLSQKVCGGILSKRDQCKVGGSDVRLIRQVSEQPCIKDVSWRFSNGVIMTEEHCRAEFAVLE